MYLNLLGEFGTKNKLFLTAQCQLLLYYIMSVVPPFSKAVLMFDGFFGQLKAEEHENKATNAHF